MKQRRALRLAWLVLVGFFALFVALLVSAGVAAQHYYVDATTIQSGSLIVRETKAELITWKPANRTIFQRASNQQVLSEGDRLRIAQSAGYGQAASLQLFDQSQLDMWAGADVQLVTLETSRWNSRMQTVVIRQTRGYVRYDLKVGQPFQQVRYQVLAGDAVVDLEPGGSYSIEMQPSLREIHMLADDAEAMVTDVAVRSGTAQVHGVNDAVVQLVAHQRVVIDPAGMPGPSIPARWQLISDGDFAQFSEEEYNNTTIAGQPTLAKSNTWTVYSVGAQDAANGFFRIAAICRPPGTNSACTPADRRRAAWFYRSGNQSRSFVTGIEQSFGSDNEGTDISEYRSLQFTMWVRVLYQSLDLAGDQGTECPVMVRFLAKRNNPTDPEHERVLCVYTQPDSGVEAAKSPGLEYYPVQPYTWYKIVIDLRSEAWLPDYRYLKDIQIYANGHDYDTRVTDVSLIGTQ